MMNGRKALLVILIGLMVASAIAQISVDTGIIANQTDYKTSLDNTLDLIGKELTDVNVIRTNTKGIYVLEYEGGRSREFNLTEGELYLLMRTMQNEYRADMADLNTTLNEQITINIDQEARIKALEKPIGEVTP